MARAWWNWLLSMEEKATRSTRIYWWRHLGRIDTWLYQLGLEQIEEESQVRISRLVCNVGNIIDC